MFIQRIILTLATGLAISVSAAPAKTNPASSPKLLPGLGEVHHPVSTKNSQAQQFFDQGLKLVFGFNHDEARKSFQRAAELDPKLAMAWWGVSLTLGPNYNLPVDPEREKATMRRSGRSRSSRMLPNPSARISTRSRSAIQTIRRRICISSMSSTKTPCPS